MSIDLECRRGARHSGSGLGQGRPCRLRGRGPGRGSGAVHRPPRRGRAEAAGRPAAARRGAAGRHRARRRAGRGHAAGGRADGVRHPAGPGQEPAQPLRVGRNKDDRFDAYVLADVVRTDARRLRPMERDSDQTTALRSTVRARRDLVGHRVAAANQLRAHLQTVFPAAAALFAGHRLGDHPGVPEPLHHPGAGGLAVAEAAGRLAEVRLLQRGNRPCRPARPAAGRAPRPGRPARQLPTPGSPSPWSPSCGS